VQFGIITLFPDMFKALEAGVIGRAIKQHLIQIDYFNPRNFTTDKHQSVDHPPYGGGPGMVMMAPPLQAAIHAAKNTMPHAKVIYLSPQGKVFDQAAALTFSQMSIPLILLAGRYEGIDQRLIETEIDEEWSIGDFILTGGELPAMLMIDAITRLLPDVLNDMNSVKEDSLSAGLLKYPQYTRPQEYEGKNVPPILLSGHHQQIHEWRLKKALINTCLKRPDLLKKRGLTESELSLLIDLIKEINHSDPS
jgi:tRNA (guanine37-N1)-methyltransferase